MTQPTRLRFWQQWMLMCIATRAIRIGFDGLASLLGGAIAFNTNNPEGSRFIIFLLLTAISSALGGWLQWRVLRQILANGRTWVLATSLGMAAALVINQSIVQLSLANARQFGTTPTDFITIFVGLTNIPPIVFDLIQGILLGTCQFLVLSKHVPQAAWWLIVSIAAVVLDGIVIHGLQAGLGQLGLDQGGLTDPVHWLIWISGGVVYGAITGGALVRLWLHPKDFGRC